MYLSDRVEHVFLAGGVHEDKLGVFLLLLLQISLKGQFLLLFLFLGQRNKLHICPHTGLYSKNQLQIKNNEFNLIEWQCTGIIVTKPDDVHKK